MLPSYLSREEIQEQTFAEFGSERLTRLCHAVGVDDAGPWVRAFQRLSRPWGDWRIGAEPRWYPSILSDDHAPFEFSTAFSAAATELQLYFEAQGGEPPTLMSNMETSVGLLEAIARENALSLERWNSVKDLFLPPSPVGLFTLLFGATWAPSKPIRYKLYLNPQILGPDATAELMREAMGRLGFADAWAAACEPRAGRSPKLDELMYLCLDLSADRAARVKVYRRHYQATVLQLDAIASAGQDYLPGEALRFYSLLAEQPGPFLAKPPITSLTFREGDARASSVTLDFPLSSYVPSDQVASDRIRRCFRAYGLDPSRYEEALRAVATRPLDRGNGIHAHVTLRRVDEGPRLTTYFATEAYPLETLLWAPAPEAPPNSVRIGPPSNGARVMPPSSRRWAARADEPSVTPASVPPPGPASRAPITLRVGPATMPPPSSSRLSPSQRVPLIRSH